VGCKISGQVMCAPENEFGASAAACRLGVLLAGVRALQLHLGNAAVEQDVCFALGLLIECGDKSVAQQLGDLGAVEAAAASLREHGADDTAHAPAKLLFKLVQQQPQNCIRALHAGVLEATAATMRMRDADGPLAYQGYSILAILCSRDGSAFFVRAAASNIAALAISGLRRLAAEDIERRMSACLLLANSSTHEEMVREVVALGGVPAILAALRVRPVDDLMVQFGVETCFNCCFHAPDLRSTLVSAGVVEGVVSAMEAKASSSRVLFFGYQALDMLTAADASATQRAINAGALRLPRPDNAKAGQSRNALFQRLNDAVAAADAAAHAKADAAMAKLLAEEAAAKAGGSAATGGSAASKKKSKA
jgi:hypothetical protein